MAIVFRLYPHSGLVQTILKSDFVQTVIVAPWISCNTNRFYRLHS